MGEMEKVLREALKLIKPSAEEEKKVMAEIHKVESKVNKHLVDAKAVLGGSGAKGTWIKGTFEADIFVRFNYKKYKERSDELSDILSGVLKKAGFKFNRVHGSRDYFQIKKGKFLFEIIPILNIKKAGDSLNITDISPLHTSFVKKHRKLRDDMRLAKQFCKSLRIYGAESYVAGFSGYVLEILVAYYSGFVGLMKGASKWGKGQVIDIEEHHTNVFMDMNKSKLVSPLIVVDPVDSNRNAAAALSDEKFKIFIREAKRFLKKPSVERFIVDEISEKAIKEKYAGKNLVLIKVKGGKGKRDVIGSKLRKVFDHIGKELKLFGVVEKDWSWDEKTGYYWFILEKNEIDKEEKRIGPPLKAKWHANNFKKKYKKTFSEKGKIYAFVARKYTKIKGYIKDVLKHKYVVERVKEIGYVD